MRRGVEGICSWLLLQRILPVLQEFGVLISDTEQRIRERSGELRGYFRSVVPVHVSMEHQQSFEEVFYAMLEQVQLGKRGIPMREISWSAIQLFARRPILQGEHYHRSSLSG